MIAYKHLLLTACSVLCMMTGYTQHPVHAEHFKAYDVPEFYNGQDSPDLPHYVLNQQKEYFPEDWYDQGFVPSCGQASAVYNVFTYEMNRLKNQAADSSSIMAPLYTYNFLNEGSGWYGASSFDSFEIAKTQGSATLADYGDPQAVIIDFEKVYYAQWMDGYEKYYRAMHNRMLDYYYLDVNDGKGLKILRHYLHDHLDQSRDGGLAFFYSGNAFIQQDPPFHYEDSILDYTNGACKVYRSFNREATHSMTLTGYITNDSIDFNGDGMVTDSLDINDDGIVDFHDNERILWVVQNSYAPPDDLLLFKYDAMVDVWDSKMFFPVPDGNYSPTLTARINMTHKQRNALCIKAGYAENPDADYPEKIFDFPIFNHQGGNKPLSGVDTLDNPAQLEFGLDLNELIESMHAKGNVRIFLLIANASAEAAELNHADVLHYQDNDVDEYAMIDQKQNIPPGQTSLFSVMIPLNTSGNDTCFKITSETLVLDNAPGTRTLSIQAGGGKKPYRFSLFKNDEYDIIHTSKEFPVIGVEWQDDSICWIDPEWPVPLGEERFDSLAVKSDGSIVFGKDQTADTPDYPYKYKGAGEYNRREIFPINGYWNKDIYYHQHSMTDSMIQIVSYKYQKIKSCTQIYRDGRICMIYDKPAFDEGRIAGIKTAKASYFSGLEPIGLSDKPNAVWFMPSDSSVGIDVAENGELVFNTPGHVSSQFVPVMAEDANGNLAYKQIKLEVMSGAEKYIEVYPNPLKETSKLIASFDAETEADLHIFSATGQLIYSRPVQLTAGLNQIDMSGLTQLESGVYICSVYAGNDRRTIRFVVI
ncbi:MAG TPA: T9SS type A sorting domain-containing protein [Bacteroidales bacterium]|nr:T9SS type A sorting domain-containing protein [Bacteroidales bacterium]